MKKNLLLIISVASGIIAFFAVICPFIPLFIPTSYYFKPDAGTSAAIGIIGGADGPTAIFVSDNFKKTALRYGFTALCTVITAVTAVLFYKLNKEGKSND